MILIFPEGKSDGFESRLPLKIFSTLRKNLGENLSCKCVIGTLIGALNFSVGIAMIVIGIQYSKKCKIDELITYLQVLGGIMVTMSIIWSTMACVSSVFYKNSTSDRFVQ